HGEEGGHHAEDAGRVRARLAPEGRGGDRRGQVRRRDRAGRDSRQEGADERARRDTSLEQLGKLRPAFPNDAPKDIPPNELTVTAGNAPGLNDGASALVVTSEAYATAHGLPIMARITGYATGGGEPRDLF